MVRALHTDARAAAAADAVINGRRARTDDIC